MRKWFMASVAVWVLLGLASMVQAQDDLKALIDKAVKAAGGADKLAKLRAMQAKSKGTMDIMGMEITYSKETLAVSAGKFKEVMEMEVAGQKVKMTQGYNGKTGYIVANGTEVPLNEKLQEEFKEAIYLLKFTDASNLKGDTFKLAPLGEIKVNNKPAAGVKVSSKGHRDVDLYFDKESGLLAKMEFRATAFMSGQEVTEERIVTEYQDIDGLKVAKKVQVLRDGKKLMDAEVTEMKFPEKIDDSEFEKP